MSNTVIPVDIFDASTQRLTIPSRVVNQVVRQEVYNNFNIYQSKYNVFKFLSIGKTGVVRLTTIRGGMPLWQPDRGCKINPMGGLDQDDQDFDVCKARLNAKWCPQEVYDSCYEGLLEWNANGQVGGDAAFGRLVAIITAEFTRSAHESLMNLVMLGGFLDVDTLPLNESLSDELLKNFKTEHNTCKGLLYKLKEKSAQYSKLLIDCFPKEDFDSKNCDYSISITDIFDHLFCEAHDDLKSIITSGASIGSGGTQLRPILILSDNLMNLLWNQVQEVSEQFLQNGYGTSKGLSCPIEVMVDAQGNRLYSVRGIPVVPLSTLCGYNRYLAGDLYFAALTVSQNIQILTNFGSRFGNLGGDGNIGIQVERETSIKNGDQGTYTFDSRALIACGLSNYNLFTGSVAFYANTEA